jgi:exodeoxyribonuclease VIII
VTISNEEYHRGEKYKDHISSSIIKKASISGRHLGFKPLYEPENKSFNLGTAFHTLILEPEKFKDEIAIAPPCDRRTKKGKEIYNIFKKDNSGKIIISSKELGVLEEMKKSVYSHPEARNILSLKNNLYEHSFFWEEKDGNKFKVRPDILNKKQSIVVDLKTCNSSSPDKFKWAIRDYGYDIQAYHYLRGMNALENNNKYKIFMFIAVETKQPYNTGVFLCSEKTLNNGGYLWHKGLKTIASKSQFHYSDEIEII